MIHPQEGLVLHFNTKFEADISIPLKIGSRDPGHDHLGVVL